MLLLAGILFSCQSDLEKVEKVAIGDRAADRTVYHAEYFYSDSGIVRNRLRAGKLEEFFVDTQRTELSDGVELLFYRPFGKPGSILTSIAGSIRQGGRVMEVRDSVRFKNYKGEILETDTLVWQQDSNIVFTDDRIRIIRQFDTIHGVGLIANEDFSRYTIQKITGKVYVHPNEEIK